MDPGPLEQAMMDRIRQMGLATDPGFVIELIDSYTPLFEKLRASLVEAYRTQDRKKLVYASHSLKGAGLNIGATELAAVARTIEEHSESSDFGSMEHYLALLEAELNKTATALASVKSKLSHQQGT